MNLGVPRWAGGGGEWMKVLVRTGVKKKVLSMKHPISYGTSYEIKLIPKHSFYVGLAEGLSHN